MSYTITVAGHTGDEEIERELVSELSKVLSHPPYGVVASNFSGLYHNGPVHAVAAAPEAEGAGG